MAAWFGVAHSSGSGWVQALGALLAGTVVVGMAGPALALRGARCSVTESPADTVAGTPVTVTIEVSTAVVVRPLAPPGREVGTGTARRCALELAPAHRGVVNECALELCSAAPFGILWWSKKVTVALPRPLHVAPLVGPALPSAWAHDDAAGDAARPVDRRVGEPRGVRDYRPGDLRSWVHWRATAHTGTLMVREMEGPTAAPATVTAVLPADPDAADEEASRALGAVAGLLAAGRPVVLVTVEDTGVVRRPVAGVLDAGRRLARALPHRAEGAGGR
jgi:uncharacterized protein (DUF58 family)